MKVSDAPALVFFSTLLLSYANGSPEPDLALVASGIGALAGAVGALIVVPPEGVWRGIGRLVFSLAMGFIFAPMLARVSWFEGVGTDMFMLRGAVAGGVVFFVWQATLTLLADKTWLVALARKFVESAEKKGGRK